MAQIRYTETVIRRAARQQIQGALGPWYWVALSLVGAFVFTGLARGWNNWLFGVLAAVAAQSVLIPLLAVRMRTRASLARLRALDDGRVSLDMTAGRFRLISRLGSIDLPLNRISRVTCRDDYWILKSGRSVLMMVPTEGVEWGTTQGWLEELRRSGAQLE